MIGRLRVWQSIAGIHCLLGISFMAIAEVPALPNNGWVSWEVNAVDNAPNWCCFEWKNKQALPAQCDLDNKNMSYGRSNDYDFNVDSMQIFVKLQDGALQKMHALSSSCVVQAKSEIIKLGRLPAEDSVEWLSTHINQKHQLSSDVLAAIAVHAGGEARQVLVTTAQSDVELKNRKDAIFWMGQVRAMDTATELKHIMFTDVLPEIREHAAFSISQSIMPDRATELIRLGNQDKHVKVRSQAWFWLAQTEALESEAAIMRALESESSSNVQEQAIFALSQLPEARAVNALIKITEDRAMSKNNRKQALFWMAQTDSPLAYSYLDTVLTRH